MSSGWAFAGCFNGVQVGRIVVGLFVTVLFLSAFAAVSSRAWAGGEAALREVPSSRRSVNAVTAVAPGLIRDLERKGLAYGAPVFIRVFKEERELEVWLKREGGFRLFRTYRVAAVSGWLGPKRREGDLQAPEGFYTVGPSQMNPNSLFHLSFDIGYPNDYDRALNRTGKALMIHGNTTSRGCFAMTDEAMEEIYALADAALRGGQSFFHVHSFPFRMTDQNMERDRDSKWYYFWTNLRIGHDLFEATKRPPQVSVRDGEYVFSQ